LLSAILATLLVGVVGPCLLVGYALSGTDRGVTFDVECARRVLAQQRPVLARVRALAARSPPPQSEDPVCRSLASELGALDIRFEACPGGTVARVVYRRFGLPETYEHQLTWTPAATADHVRSGGFRLGEYFEYVDDGWWWVTW